MVLNVPRRCELLRKLLLVFGFSFLANATCGKETGWHRVQFYERHLGLKRQDFEEIWNSSDQELRTVATKAVHEYLRDNLSRRCYITSSTMLQKERSTFIEASFVDQDKRGRLTLRGQRLSENQGLGPDVVLSGEALFFCRKYNSSVPPGSLSDVVQDSISHGKPVIAQKITESLRYKVALSLAQNLSFSFPGSQRIDPSFKANELSPVEKEKVHHRRSLTEEKKEFYDDIQIDECPAYFKSNSSFYPGDFICSPDKTFFFGLSPDGDLGIWKGSKKVWSGGTCCLDTVAQLQLDGKFVVHGEGHEFVLEPETYSLNFSAATVRLSNNGSVTVTSEDADNILVAPPGAEVVHQCTSRLAGKHHLQPGDHICSPSGRYSFGLAADGDLALWSGPKKVWSGVTCCKDDGVAARLQEDGNFVVRSGNKHVLWASSTNNGFDLATAELFLGNNGVVTIQNEAAGKSWILEPSVLNVQLLLQEKEGELDEACVEHVEGPVVLGIGDFICSSGGKYRFGMTLGGNLALLEDGDTQLWSAGTCCAEDGVFSSFENESGNIIVKTVNDEMVWTSGIEKELSYNSSLSVNDNGVAAITNQIGKKIWVVPPPGSKGSCQDQKMGNFVLTDGEYICSPNGRFRFGVFDADLSLWNVSKLVWSAGTCCIGDNVFMKMRTNGNLAVLSGNKTELWSTKTRGNHGASVTLHDDGIVRITNLDGVPVWKSTWANDGQPVPSPQPTSPLPRSPSLIVLKHAPLPGTPSASPTTIPSAWPTSLPTITPTMVPSSSPSISPSSWPTTPPTMMPSSSPTTPPTILPTMTPSKPTPQESVCIEVTRGRVNMAAGEFVCSPKQRFRFGLTFEGDLAVLDGDERVWSAGICCAGDTIRAQLQLDGNLVVSNSSTVLWTSKTAGQNLGLASLMVGEDGVATISCPVRGHIWSSAVEDGEVADATSLERKVMAGYQGWFFTGGDGGLNRWQHWSKPRTVPDEDTVTIDMWPDLRELDTDELHPTNFTYMDGSTASLYSAYNTKTVERHCRWMKEYGVDGVFVQRFIGNALSWTSIVDQVLGNVRSGSEKHGRVFAVMYDIGNGDDETIAQDIINDWKHLVDEQNITQSRNYLRHRGRPLLGIWGFGFHDRLGDPSQVAAVIDWLRNTAEEKYRVTLMGGVPAGWRDLSRDSKSVDSWASVYRSYDVISPWTVGRMVDERSADYFLQNYIEPDVEECDALNIDYMPVVFPGFSSSNLYPTKKPFNEIPRRGGTFFWHQLHNAINAGNSMLYVAMFDEVDEATAIFKIAENASMTPREGRFLTLDADLGYPDVPSDWYLRLTGAAADLLHKGRKLPEIMPSLP